MIRFLSVWIVLVLASVVSVVAQPNQTRNVVLITIDGLRWQEVFRGADAALFDKEFGGVPSNQQIALREDFWAETADERRKKLMPFFWGEIATRGQLFGNRDVGSVVSVRNDRWISYPGYNEILTGRVDPRVSSNVPLPNPNVTVLEWLNGLPEFSGKVAACAEWRVFTAILNVGRSRLPVWVTRQHSPASTATPRLLEIEKWMENIPPIAPDEHFDAFVHEATLDTFNHRQPRVFLYALGEPDAWAHGRRYDRYLYSIQRCDRFIRELWEKLQALDQYRGSTTFLITTDHGRGVTPDDWAHHGQKIPFSQETWLAALGPDTPALGERGNFPEIYQAQVASTLVAFLGLDFRTFSAEAEEPITQVLRGGK
ncbi:MAG TPA: alkaline phosphatase family protein [Opitutaceae bacterium]|nr:alkaline phosphatase family protein [Opitutaceae bacterium]